MRKNLREHLKKQIFENKDENALFLYGRLHATEEFATNLYSIRNFGLCRELGIMNIYDIGCGFFHQAFFLTSFEDMRYLGIESDKEFNSERLNSLFAQNNENIKFQRAEYPCDITTESNNIAIAFNSIATMNRGEEKIKNIAKALSNDFERIIMTVWEETIELWQTSLPDFTFYTLGGQGDLPIVFATKFPDEIAKLEEMKYNYFDDDGIQEFFTFDFTYDFAFN
jgi:hypothetical protein